MYDQNLNGHKIVKCVTKFSDCSYLYKLEHFVSHLIMFCLVIVAHEFYIYIVMSIHLYLFGI